MSIKVMIVDDEVLVRKGLKAMVPWSRYGMEVVADAPNGRKGWEAFMQIQPELVITDIVMPEMDGLELCRRVKEQAPQTKVLLLSCHRDFTFAQQGISLGVSGYLLKTEFQDDEWDSLLQRMRAELTGEKKQPSQPRERQKEWRLEFGTWLTGLNRGFEQSLAVMLEAQWSWMNDATRVWLLAGMGEYREEQERVMLSRELDTTWEWIPCGDHRFLFCPADSCRQVESLLVEWKLAGTVTSWETAGPFSGREQWLLTVRTLYKKTEWAKKFGVMQDAWQEPIRQAVHYALDRLDTPLTVSEVASQVGLSRSHFSVLFKKGVGESFGEFLDKRRVRIAQGMLGETTMSIQEVAERVGLPDAKYFSKWFKKYTGMSPSHYRFKQKEESGRTIVHSTAQT
ncbi:response regulator [Brevibacillus parabrevis]|uniref:response regulator n=1 Tax=Brevibacillus parabrevis TaxID=54914 RepID=UPI0028D5D41C|nr:response regulator [Brevibacillus parabrevis]MED1722784.1 response regulator [Brevibacillus parabrevis]